jgi:hypothetical protein
LDPIIEQATRKIVEKHARTRFIIAWILVAIIEVANHFHHDFQASLQAIHAKTWGLIWATQNGLNNR